MPTFAAWSVPLHPAVQTKLCGGKPKTKTTTSAEDETAAAAPSQSTNKHTGTGTGTTIVATPLAVLTRPTAQLVDGLLIGQDSSWNDAQQRPRLHGHVEELKDQIALAMIAKTQNGKHTAQVSSRKRSRFQASMTVDPAEVENCNPNRASSNNKTVEQQTRERCALAWKSLSKISRTAKEYYHGGNSSPVPNSNENSYSGTTVAITGCRKLDELLSPPMAQTPGWSGGQVLSVVGATGTAKTQLALQLAVATTAKASSSKESPSLVQVEYWATTGGHGNLLGLVTRAKALANCQTPSSESLQFRPISSLWDAQLSLAQIIRQQQQQQPQVSTTYSPRKMIILDSLDQLMVDTSPVVVAAGGGPTAETDSNTLTLAALQPLLAGLRQLARRHSWWIVLVSSTQQQGLDSLVRSYSDLQLRLSSRSSTINTKNNGTMIAHHKPGMVTHEERCIRASLAKHPAKVGPSVGTNPAVPDTNDSQRNSNPYSRHQSQNPEKRVDSIMMEDTMTLSVDLIFTPLGLSTPIPPPSN